MSCRDRIAAGLRLGNLLRHSRAKAKAHQLFGEQLPKLLDELNEVLAG